jgi:hypothetical protein
MRSYADCGDDLLQGIFDPSRGLAKCALLVGHREELLIQLFEHCLAEILAIGGVVGML